MIDDFDKKSDKNITTAYPTREEIENIINSALNKNSQSIQDRVINKLAKSAVGVFITIIIASFATFGALTYFISITKENIELKAKVEKLQLDIQMLQNNPLKVIIFLTIINDFKSLYLKLNDVLITAIN